MLFGLASVFIFTVVNRDESFVILLPPSAGFRYTNITKEFSNVNATVVGNTSLVYEVINATVTNRVNLTCVANSSYATTTLTYLAFVGGKTLRPRNAFLQFTSRIFYP